MQIKAKTVWISVKHTAPLTKAQCGMSSFYVGRDLGERYNTKGTESNVQLCCGFRQRLGRLLSVLRAMYISAVTSVRETRKLLIRALRAMYSSAVASVREIGKL